MKQRVPMIVSTVALVVALLGSTPLGHAALRVLPLARFAQNADRVDGLDASRKPTPGKLLALDASGRLPAAVLPEVATGASGTPGLQGEQGPRGERGPSDGFARYRDRVLLSRRGTLASVDLPVGNYIVVAKAHLETSAIFTCGLHVGTESDETDVSRTYSSGQWVPFTVAGNFTRPTRAEFRCARKYGYDDLVASSIRIAAISVASLDNAEAND